jgi:hypothetical protein
MSRKIDQKKSTKKYGRILLIHWGVKKENVLYTLVDIIEGRNYPLKSKDGWLATVRNKRAIDSERVQGHSLPVVSMVLGKGGRNDLGAREFWRVLG